jgi:CHAT domain-containing protein
LATAYEIQGLDLSGTELVVLSACESGLGVTTVGSGIRGRRQGFLQAGARRIVSSLWKVPDAETAELMENFYHRLLEGQPAGTALNGAMRTVRDRRLEVHGTAHPFFWGGFVLVGDPARIAIDY